jgi:menaquinone-9 beta-reductase
MPDIESQKEFDVIIVGGGLAGFAAAIELALQGRKILLLEKKKFPRHKVCGEYVSNEVLPVLNYFGINPFDSGALSMKRFVLSSPSGKSVSSNLPLGAFSLSRYRLDELLYKKALSLGVDVRTGSQASLIQHLGENSVVTAGKHSFKSRFVIGAFGKTSNMRPKTGDDSNSQKGRYFAVKRHIRTDFPNDLVALHNFSGGYCGVSKIEDDKVNVCYMALSKDLNHFGSIKEFEKQIVFRNPKLKRVFENAEELFDRPMAISNFSMGAKDAVSDGVFMAGDSAGMISPLCGNGMAMAISSGFHLAKLLNTCMAEGHSKIWAEKAYTRFWKSQFSTRLFWGGTLQHLFGKPVLSNFALNVLSAVPALAPKIIEKTHGDVILA